MKSSRILAVLTAVMMILTTAYAGELQDDNSGLHNKVSVEFIDITGGYEKGNPALTGEAKILVRATGLTGDATIAQTRILFEGNLKYKGIQYLIGKNSYPECFLHYPDAAYANFTGEILTSAVTNSEYVLPFKSEGTDLFILTFHGEPGESVDLILGTEDSYYIMGEDEYLPEESAFVSAASALSGVERKTASIKLTMDKVTTFEQMSGGEYSDSRISVSIADEQDGYTFSTALNNVLIADGGHRNGSSIVPVFEVTTDAILGKTYTVRISGYGYVTYEKKGETFDSPLELTNSDFVPGDINGDGLVDASDKELCTQAVSDEAVSEKYLWATDINRDGVVNDNDLQVFADIGNGDSGETGKDNENTDDKDDSGNKDDTDNKDDGDNEGSGDSSGGSTGGSSGGGSSGGSSSGGGSSGGKGGSSFGGGFSPVTGSQTPVAPQGFADLAGFEWAEDAIYSLKNKGIITGTSAIAFSPADNIKRGDFILILTRMIDMGNEDPENFSDVAPDSYYASAISKAKRAGIAKGSGNEFHPESSITRQDLITLAYRAFLNAGLISETTDFSSLDQFADKGSIADYALAPLASMVTSGIIKGSGGNVNPNGNATRAEVAVMCERLLKLKN